jgi:AraC-like DNA-binding protein
MKYSSRLSHCELPPPSSRRGSSHVDPQIFSRGSRVGLTQIGLIDALCLAAPTPERALAYVCKLSPLWSPTSVQLVREGDGTSVCARPFDSNAQSQGHIAVVSFWLRLVERVASTTVYPRCIQLPSTPEPQRRELRAAFTCVIHFDRPAIAVEFRSLDLEQPNPNADAALVKLLSRYAEDRLSTLQRVQGTVAQLNRLLGSMDDVADASADALAAALGIGSRTLHRRLRAERTSYRRVVQDFRMRRCVEQLRLDSASAKEIAFRLGFSSPASFHRAFRRWTGCTVGEYRRQGDEAPDTERVLCERRREGDGA